MEKSFEISGIIKRIGEMQEFGTFAIRELIIQTLDDKYPQMLKFDVTGKAIDELGKRSEGDKVLVRFSHRGKEWQGKYFVTLNAYYIKLEG
jgi:hypothetical protein